MALLQISEPDASARPHQQRLAVGIDLGTTHSLIATVRNGIAETLPDENGRVLLPSVVRYLPDGTVRVGETARTEAADDPRNTMISVKRMMGRGLKDLAHRDSMPYEFIDTAGMVQIRTVAGEKSPVEI